MVRPIALPAKTANHLSKAIGQEKEKMSKPEFFVTPGFGERFRLDLHFSAAVRIGNRVETSGQGAGITTCKFRRP